ncbi:MAG: hypothetical protein ACTSRZ_15000 [Promethearchaeota archaeon]
MIFIKEIFEIIQNENQYSNNNDITNHLLEQLMEICKEIYYKNKKLSYNSIINKSLKSLNISKLEIEKLIHILIEQGRIVPNSYLIKDNILENSTRKKIYQLLLLYPALSINQFKEILEIGSNMVIWNLKKLLDFKIINDLRIGRFHIFYLFSTSEELAKFYFLINRKKAIKKIFELLIIKPHNSKEILVKINSNLNSIKNFLSKFIELNIIKEHKGYFSISKMYKPLISKVLKIPPPPLMQE